MQLSRECEREFILGAVVAPQISEREAVKGNDESEIEGSLYKSTGRSKSLTPWKNRLGESPAKNSVPSRLNFPVELSRFRRLSCRGEKS